MLAPVRYIVKTLGSIHLPDIYGSTNRLELCSWLLSFLPSAEAQPRPQGFSLKKCVGREKALASAGHVYSLNIPEKLIYMHPAGFALTGASNNGK